MILIPLKNLTIRVLSIMVFMHLVTGCQLTGSEQSTVNLGSYYLWLNQLSKAQLTEELELQQSLQEKPQTEVYLAILYSRAKSDFYNPYRAKTILNKLTEPNKAQLQFSVYHLPASDLAFLSMLKEQLNEQLLAIEKTVSIEQKVHLMQQHINNINHESTELKQQSSTLKQLNEKLNEKNLMLNRKINQLKNIEQAINKRGN